MRAAFLFYFFLLDREGGAAERFFFYFLCQNRGAAALQKGGAAEKYFFYFGVRIGMREPLERSGSVFWLILSQFRVGNCLNGTNRVREKFFLASQFRVREKFFLFVSLLEGGGRHLFIFAAKIRVRAAFIFADLQIHEGGGGLGGERAGLRN